MAAAKPVDPDLHDEDPEDCIGDLILDPWADAAQTDWPDNDDEEDSDESEDEHTEEVTK